MKNLSMDVSGYVKYDIDYPEGWTVEFDGLLSHTIPSNCRLLVRRTHGGYMRHI